MIDDKVFSELSFHHIGYAVPCLKTGLQRFAPFAFQLGETAFVDKQQSVSVVFVRLPGGPLLEFVAPLDKASPISNFVSENEFGALHHLAFEADDYQTMVSKMKLAGYRRVTPITVGFEGRNVSFYLPRDGAKGPLIELVSKKK